MVPPGGRHWISCGHGRQIIKVQQLRDSSRSSVTVETEARIWRGRGCKAILGKQYLPADHPADRIALRVRTKHQISMGLKLPISDALFRNATIPPAEFANVLHIQASDY